MVVERKSDRLKTMHEACNKQSLQQYYGDMVPAERNWPVNNTMYKVMYTSSYMKYLNRRSNSMAALPGGHAGDQHMIQVHTIKLRSGF